MGLPSALIHSNGHPSFESNSKPLKTIPQRLAELGLLDWCAPSISSVGQWIARQSWHHCSSMTTGVETLPG